MLYLLTPPAALHWCDLSGVDALDLGALDWTDTGQPVTEDMVRLALRYGTQCSRGLVLDAVIVRDLDRSSELREANDQSNVDRSKVNDVEKTRMEASHPGWTRRSDQMDERVEIALGQMTDELDARAARELVAPVNPDLLAAWVNMGGRVPTEA